MTSDEGRGASDADKGFEEYLQHAINGLIKLADEADDIEQKFHLYVLAEQIADTRRDMIDYFSFIEDVASGKYGTIPNNTIFDDDTIDADDQIIDENDNRDDGKRY